MDWEATRDAYPTLSQGIYLNSCSLGALSNTSRAAANRWMDQWTARGAASWYDHWMDELQLWRDRMAKLLGCRSEEVAWTPSVAAALGSLSSALDRQYREDTGRYAGRTDVVIARREFPSSHAAFKHWPDTKIRFVEDDSLVHVEAESYAAQMEGARAVSASRVFYNSGAIQDVEAITAAARKEGALAIVEDYQGTGQVPLHMHDQNLDVIVGGSLKWLCGGMAVGFMAIRKDLIQEFEPQYAGWWANAGMFEFQGDDFRFWDDARRFEGGEVNMGAVILASQAVQDLLDLGGVEAIHQRNTALTNDLMDRLDDANISYRRHQDRDKHSAILMVERDDPKADVKRLEKKHKIIVDDRPGCVRVSPHFYNTEAENQAFVEGLRA